MFSYKFLPTGLAMHALFLLIILFCHYAIGAGGGSLVNVEGYVNNYVDHKYTDHLELAIEQAKGIAPRTKTVSKLLTILEAVETKAGTGNERNRRLLANAQTMFDPLKESRRKLFEIKHKIGTVGHYDNTRDEDERLIQETFKLFYAEQQSLEQEAQQKGYRHLAEALGQLGKAIDQFKAAHVPFGRHYGPGNDCGECKQIESLTTKAAEEGLREVFGLYGSRKNE